MTLLWGKPDITATVVTPASGGSSNLTIPTPVKNSTRLTTNAGEKHTADLEGGGYEGVRYDKSSFVLEFSVRFAVGRTMPFEDKSADGVVEGTFKFEVAAEDAPGLKMTMNEAMVRYEDELDADDGARRHYYCESIMPVSGNQIDWSHTQTAGQ